MVVVVKTIITVLVGFALLAGSLRAEFVYVANADGSISAYRIGEEGTLTPVAGSPFPAGRSFPASVTADFVGRLDRTSVVYGKSAALGGGRNIKLKLLVC